MRGDVLTEVQEGLMPPPPAFLFWERFYWISKKHVVNGGVEKEQHAHTPDPGWIAIAEGNRSSSPARSRLVVARRRGDAELGLGGGGRTGTDGGSQDVEQVVGSERRRTFRITAKCLEISITREIDSLVGVFNLTGVCACPGFHDTSVSIEGTFQTIFFIFAGRVIYII